MSANRFAAIFEGLAEAYGVFKVERTAANGKNTGKAAIIREARTKDL